LSFLGCNVRLMFPRLWAPFGNTTEVTNLPPLPKSHSGKYIMKSLKSSLLTSSCV